MTTARSPKVIRRGTSRHGSCLPNKRRWDVRHNDCLQALPKLQADSIDAIVTDPPYGLEFMGNEWDRIGDIGKASHRGFDDKPGSKGFRFPRYNASANVKCRRCRKWKWTQEDHRCQCIPFGDFPNIKADQGRRMQEWHERWAHEALRVLKPGGHLLAFGGTRTFHRLTCALEDAGFEIRDCLCWLYGSGFPKSLNVAVAIDKAEGCPPRGRAIPVASTHLPSGRYARQQLTPHKVDRYQARSAAGRAWEGWGTTLKPAWEPIILARKPLDGTVAQNIQRHGTGALNIDSCRVAFRSDEDERESKVKNRHADFGSEARKNRVYGQDERTRGNYNAPGRWPANMALSHSEDCQLIGPTCLRSNGHHPATRGAGGVSTTGHRGQKQLAERSSAGELVGCWECSPNCAARLLDEQSDVSPSRFFYSAKASRAERDAGLEETSNTHPTVKPIDLMRWLVRLVTPPGGTVLDPFAGSGTTGAAVVLEGANFIGIERDPTYVAIARARIKHWAKSPKRHGQ